MQSVHAIRANHYTVLAFLRSFSRFYQQVEHNASLFQYVLFRRTMQNYTKIFNSRTSDCEIQIKCDGFVHYLAFGTRFRLRNLMHRAADREIRLRNSMSIEVYMPHITGCAGLRGGLYAPYIAPRNLESGLCTPYRAPRKVAGRSHNPYERAIRYSPFVFFGKK